MVKIRALTKGISLTLAIINIFISVFMIVAAYSGYINPLENAKFAVLGMLFPILLILAVLMMMFWIFFKQWKYSLISLFTIVACWGPVYTYCPLNLFSKEVSGEQKENSFTLLTYNIMNYCLYNDEGSDDHNQTVQYIIDSNPDIACLQECYGLVPPKAANVAAWQLDTLKCRYKYIKIDTRDIAIFSKYPFEKTVEEVPKLDGCGVGAYRVNINGRYVTVINVHLESIGLTTNDKELYMELTALDADTKEKLKDVRSQLLWKLTGAFRNRARQAMAIREFINKLDGEIIVCGDFNDVPDSYSYRTIKGDMKDAYVECGFGPLITYHANRFYFKIDQIFYSGNMLDAVKIKCVKNPSSDHYPLLVDFVWKEQINK